MKSFGIIFIDELRGFMKSKAMIALWIGMPIVAILMHALIPQMSDFPTSYFSQYVVSVLGGILGVVSLSVTMTNEINNKVYDLFLIRPVKRWHIVISKFLAVFINILIACFISLTLGIIIDLIRFDYNLGEFFAAAAKSVTLSAVGVSVCCACGLLIGTLIKSVAVSAIISVYLGQQLSQLIQLPSLIIFEWNPNLILLLSAVIGLILTVSILFLEIFAFNKKQF
jgi:ABC-2 type transport system permease protein